MARSRGGRPSSYRDEFAKQAVKLCRLGATDADLAAFFEVDERTINRWKAVQPEFCQSLKDGKALADAEVGNSLYRRAVGYDHEAVKIVADAKTGAEHIVPYIERFPPDTTACIFWLKNRRPDLWRDRFAHEHSGPDGGPVEIADARQRNLDLIDAVARRKAGPADPGATRGGDGEPQ
jgi:hypothetical protein